MLVLGISVLALILGIVMPLRWGIWGYLAGATLAFLVQFGINASGGFAGASLEDSLLLFNGSLVGYLGFNLQITYRAFAGPLLALSAAVIYRMSLRRD